MGNCNSSNELKDPQTGVPLDKMIEKSRAICKIILKETNQDATGFFMEIYPSFQCLLTNYHVISQEMVDADRVIEIVNDSGIKMEINLNKNERYIRCFKDPIDITVIQIKKTDHIIKYYNVLEYDLTYKNKKNNYRAVYILQHRLGNPLENARGKIIEISDFQFSHSIDTDRGSSGSPILLLYNSKVIGIHKSGDIKNNINYGTFIEAILNEINKDIKNGLIKNIDLELINNFFSSDNRNCKKHKSNYIIAEIYINIQKINKDVLIINSYEEMQRNSRYQDFNEDLKNEKDIKDCEIQIDEEKIDFSYYHKFPKVGIYKIKYSFKNALTNTNYMFYKCSSLISIDLSHFNTENITDMRLMFFQCKLLRNINLSNINTQNLIYMSGIFSFCYSLKNLDLSNFNTENVKDMNGLFIRDISLESVNLRNFNTINTIDMSLMFCGCYFLKNLDLSNFNTQNVKYMKFMFGDCPQLKNIDLSNFNTQNLMDAEGMFTRCYELTQLNLENFNAQNIRNMSSMFKGCISLKKENLILTDEKILEEYLLDDNE